MPLVLGFLASELNPRSIFVRVDPKVRTAESIAIEDHRAYGVVPDEPIELAQHGVRFKIDLGVGQKTGFYLDQRENRTAFCRYACGRHAQRR